jgi:hypothetical protein
MRLVKWLFLLSGTYGVLLVAPMFFLEARLVRDYPPELTHPEFYYGFVGVTLMWQIVYLAIGLDPVRYRLLMLLGATGKASFVAACLILHLQGRVATGMVGIASPDALMAALFVVAWLRTPGAWPKPGA